LKKGCKKLKVEPKEKKASEGSIAKGIREKYLFGGGGE